MYPNEENMIIVPITERLEIITAIQVCLISWININSKENGGNKSFSCKIQSINIVYLNEENMIVVPITKKKELITTI